MLTTRRQLPPAMIEVERRIEEWRSNLINSLDPRIDAAIYFLVLATCQSIEYQIGKRQPIDPFQLELYARRQLFALQFALSGLNGNIPEERFIEDLISSTLTREKAKRIIEILEKMYYYSLLRDIFLTYAWGGYELDQASHDFLRFVDHPDWTGARDRAQVVIAQEIQEDMLRSLTSSILTPTQFNLERRTTVLPTLSLGGLTARQFVSAWSALAQTLSRTVRIGQSNVVEKGTTLEIVAREADLSLSESKRFIDLITFDSKGTGALTLFHCPLVPVTSSSFLIVLPGFLASDLSACIPRLAVHRGPGIDTYSNKIEAQLLARLGDHYRSDGVIIKTRLSYSSQTDSGDIDLVVYESETNRLVMTMVKAFILPDTVEEVIRANQSLEKGLDQLTRARNWVQNLSKGELAQSLGISLPGSLPSIHYMLVGNGFGGSDYLSIPPETSVVDANYLLLSRFSGRSILSAMDSYENRLSTEGSKAASEVHFETISLAGIRIEVPSWTHAILNN